MPSKTLYPDYWTQNFNAECLHQRLTDVTRSVQASPEARKVYCQTCTNCELLLQVVEHVKLGWMEAMEAREHECGMITVLLDTFGDELNTDRWVRPHTIFQYFGRSQRKATLSLQIF